MTDGPSCEFCGRPSRFNRDGVYQCKPDCATVAQATAAYAQAFNQMEAARAMLEGAGGSVLTITAPPPPEDNLEDMEDGVNLTGVDGSGEGGGVSTSAVPDLTVEDPAPQPKPKRTPRRKRAAV